MSILWKLEQDFKYALEDAINSAKYDDLTIKELLDLGFNNNDLILPNGKHFNIGWIDINGNYHYNLTDKQLKTHVYMKEDFGWYDDEDTDGDGYHIAKVYLRNEEDEGLFHVCDDD